MSKLISVRNRNNGSTGYSIPEKNLWRNFAPNETKKIPLEELQELQYQPGGDYMLKNLLIIEDQDALDVLNMQVEPEYNYTESDIRDILLNGTLDQLRDFLDFAPAGGIEICKEIAVKEEIPDVRKREIISQATGFDINSAIMVNKVMDAEDEKPQEQKKERRTAVAEGTKQRRVAVSETSSSAEEKPAAAKYKILSK
jgi:hypothetical protein